MLPSVAGVVIFVLLPFLDVVRRSFVTAVTQEWIGFRNYKIIFSNQAFGLAVKNTVRFTLVCLPLLIGIGLFLSVQLSRLKEMQLIKSLFLFPMAMPAATVVLIWKMMFSRQGFLNGWLMGAGFPGDGALPDYMGTSAAFWVLVFSYIWKNLGYTMVLWLAGIFSVSTDLTEAARVDGASTWHTYWKIIFPIMKPMHATVAVITALAVWNDVMTPLVIMAGSSQNTLPLAQLNFQSQFGTNYNLAFASYLLSLIPILIFYLICQKQILNGVVNGAVK